MKIALTGGTGFVGRHLARELASQGHQIVLISRGKDARDESIRELRGVQFIAVGTDNTQKLAAAFAGCEAVAHCAGINREIGAQTYDFVHVEGTKNVLEAAQTAGVKKIALLSFLRARAGCGSKYHESKWQAEELVRNSGLDFTILKAGMIYGRGDHMLDHLSHTLHTFPFFAKVGFREQTIRPVAVADVVKILVAALVEGRLERQTVAVVGPEPMKLSQAVRKVARLTKRPLLVFPAPVVFHQILALFFEKTMSVPLISSAQVFMLGEDMSAPVTTCEALPDDLQPQTPFSDAQVLAGLPEKGRFGPRDLLCCARIKKAAG